MKTELKIAWRYLFAKKQFNAIHIITAISSAAVGVVTAAMICVLSVMNGFGVMVERLFSQFDPDLRITAKAGKSFSINEEKKHALLELPCVDLLSESISETALVYFEDKQMPVQLMGVDTSFSALTGIENIITDGHYEVYDGAFDRAVLGQGLAWKLGIGAHFVHGIQVYAPKREGKVNMLRPDANFNQERCFIAGTFAVNQQKYDDNLMLVDIGLTRRLLDYDSTEVTALQVGVNEAYSIKQTKREIATVLGDGYVLQDRFEQQEDFFRILRVEKLLTALLLIFILLSATFNGIGSLSMLIIDKQQDIRTLSHLGASDGMIRKVFVLEGWMVNTLGAIGGLIVGLGVCLLQEHFGLLKLGNGSEYVLNAYPVAVQGWDIALVSAVVLVLGAVSSWIPARKINIER
ncbi:MAG: ABC transporter permease [Paludibacteraceae bacterium]|nr:ABC transporter permease [Paludibacteraceae bacterium]